ncbi:MAG TPA: GDSL-type esterase/lipase family protein [Tepidisphaeraceae bacterium]|jgi:lysophospholipase L1-like esterase
MHCTYLLFTAATLLLATASFAADPKPVRILMLGDSVTALGLPKATAQALNNAADGPQRAKTALHWETINAGAGGETAAGGLARIAKLLDKENPDIVTISFGLNDTWQREGTEKFRNNMLAIIDIVQGHPSKPRPPWIVLLTSTPFDDTRHFLGKEKSMIEQGGPDRVLEMQYNRATRQLALDKGFALVDLHRHFFTDPRPMRFLNEDGVHPNEQGFEFAGKYIATTLLAWYAVEIDKDKAALAARKKTLAELATLSDAKLTPEKKRRILQQAWQTCPYLPEAAVAWDEFTYPSATMPSTPR